MFLVAKAHGQLHKTPLPPARTALWRRKAPKAPQRSLQWPERGPRREQEAAKNRNFPGEKSPCPRSPPPVPPPGPIPPVLGPMVTRPGGAGDRKATASPMQHPQDRGFRLQPFQNNPTLRILPAQMGKQDRRAPRDDALEHRRPPLSRSHLYLPGEGTRSEAQHRLWRGWRKLFHPRDWALGPMQGTLWISWLGAGAPGVHRRGKNSEGKGLTTPTAPV